ncbi:MAG: hypothetical protein V1921_05595 [Candidatus Altiarchaeota archaeon]
MLEAVSNGSALLVDSSSIGRGASFAITLGSKAGCELTKTKTITPKSLPAAVRKAAKVVLDYCGKKSGARLSFSSEIPKEAGLGFEESIAVASAVAVTGALARERGSVMELKVDKYLKEQFYVIDGTVVDRIELARELSKQGLDFSRVCCSLFGGFFITDDRKLEVLRRGENEGFSVVACTLKKAGKSALFRNEVQLAWDEALKGNLYSAMNMNALLHGSETAREVTAKMLEAGAVTTSYSGNSVLALIRDPEKVVRVKNSAKKFGDVILTSTSNTQTSALMKPRRIVKTAEFLEIKGDSSYYFL